MGVTVRAQVMLKKVVQLNAEENKVNTHDYMEMQQEYIKEVTALRAVQKTVTIMSKYMRRKIAYMKIIRMRADKKKMDKVYRFLRRRVKRIIKRRDGRRLQWLVRYQAVWRGYSSRRRFYWSGLYKELFTLRAKKRLKVVVWRCWQYYKAYRKLRLARIIAGAPKTVAEWQALIDLVKQPRRVLGVFEEYLYPPTYDIKFYRNSSNGELTFKKPKWLKQIDIEHFNEAWAMRNFGCSLKMERLATKLQAYWRGFVTRKQFDFICRSTNICDSASEEYLKHPDSDRNLFNYALFCHVVQGDYDRARRLYIELLKRMQHKGPDIPQILYAYAIFAFVCHDADYHETLHYIERGRVAEEQNEIYIRKRDKKEPSKAIENGTYTHGRVFELASIGFFRYQFNMKPTEKTAHNYAVCRFLVYNDFPGSFDAFLEAFKYDPGNRRLAGNYKTMMAHFHGDSPEVVNEVKLNRLLFWTAKDDRAVVEEREAKQRWELRTKTAQRIQVFENHF